MKKISIVTSLYKSSKYVNDFYSRHLACIRKLNLNYEFIFVDDGYPDDSKDKVLELIKLDNNIRLILFSRNFGQYPAMFAGMTYAQGDYIYTSDSDLEESPENILLLFDIFQHGIEVDFVYGVVDNRKGGLIRNIFGSLFFKIMNWMSSIEIPKNMSWQIIMTKRYKDVLLKYNEVETLPAGLMTLTGFNQVPFTIEKKYKGSTTYSFSKRIKLAINSITSFSSKPLVLIGLFGFLISFLAFSTIFVVIISNIFYKINYQLGWISMIGSIWLVGGLILISIGVIGIYLAKIFNQVKGRPLYVIKNIIN
jgi:putative glycosyltransferase